MGDRITPATTNNNGRYLVDMYRLVDERPVIAEPLRRWIIEDDLAADRLDISAGGAVMSDSGMAGSYGAGDQAGAASKAASSVRLIALDPSAFMT